MSKVKPKGKKQHLARSPNLEFWPLYGFLIQDPWPKVGQFWDCATSAEGFLVGLPSRNAEVRGYLKEDTPT